ncbi:peptidylprolyl isomerase [Flavicella marina]|uniref:peptidylprolyl isomerase n=1 Tax=Flavicella marina TaxID=1475951 RepID=UPI0012659E3B|nr:peptidylprolyl isomerase [Flavicella marina]
MNKFLKNPLWLFLAIGVLLFTVDYFMSSAKAEKQLISLTERDIDKIIDTYAGANGVKPDSITLQKLIQLDIENRLLYDLGMELGLDKNDLLVRDRVAQLTEQYVLAGADLSDPGDDVLQLYLKENKDQFIIPAYYEFNQYFFGNDEKKASQQAFFLNSERGIEGFRNEDVPVRQKGNINRIAELFGVLFAGELNTHQANWIGVLKSNFGYHVVQVQYYSSPHDIDIKNIEERFIVLNNWRKHKQQAFLENKLDVIKSSYTIQVENFSN